MQEDQGTSSGSQSAVLWPAYKRFVGATRDMLEQRANGKPSGR